MLVPYATGPEPSLVELTYHITPVPDLNLRVPPATTVFKLYSVLMLMESSLKMRKKVEHAVIAVTVTAARMINAKKSARNLCVLFFFINYSG